MAGHSVRGEFIILKKTKYSEADLILQGISAEGQRFSFLAKGALRSKKRFSGGVLEPTHLVDFQYLVSSKSTGLHILEDARLIEGFSKIREDYDRLSLALFALDCVYRVSQEGDEQSPVLYQLLGHLLRALNEEGPSQILKIQFLTKFLYQQGVLKPEVWMQPYLKTSLHQAPNLLISNVEDSSPIKDIHEKGLEVLAKRYITTAEL